MDARSILRTKRDGAELSEEEIRYFITEYVKKEIPDYQASALLMAIFLNGMQPRELELWTRAMLESGSRLAFPELDCGVVDKHSTGGVGDKVSIPLAPAVAACGLAVPMISGRGLAHTGGTLDKLESIPGFRTGLSEDEIRHGVSELGLAFAGQTKDIVPADRMLYRLRDVTGLIESVPLIASSIMSKKLAEGIGGLVLDVKFGAGAFLPEPERGRELARVMMQLARDMGVEASAYQTSMHEPLGFAVGHALEIEESLACLSGEGPADLRELVCLFGGEMLVLGGACDTHDEGRARIEAVLDDGRAMGVFERVVEAQGGEPGALSHLARAAKVEAWCAEEAGVLEFVDTRMAGLACCALGGGRRKLTDAIDPAVGFVWLVKAGEVVERGDVLCEIHHSNRGLEEARACLGQAVRIGAAFELPPLVLGRVDGGSP